MGGMDELNAKLKYVFGDVVVKKDVVLYQEVARLPRFISEYLISSLGKEKPEEAKYRGFFNTIGDMEHVEIVKLYIEEQLSMEKIGKQLKRSNKSIHDHLTKHDAQIESLGYCPQCRRSKGKYETVRAKRV